MRSLVITKFSPLPSKATHGSSKRLRLLLSAVCSLSDAIEIAYFARQEEITALAPLAPHETALSASWGLPVRLNPIPIRLRAKKTAWNQYAAGALSVWQQEGYYEFAGADQLARVAESLARGPDLVLASRLPSMGAFLRSGTRPPGRLFFDLDDIEHKTRLRAVLAPPFWPGKLLSITHIPQIFLAERRAAEMAAATFVCSELDRRYLSRVGMGRNVEVVPNGMPVPTSRAPPAAKPTVLFLGNYGYPPNCGAADRLIRQIWPLIRQRVPEARLLIAGELPERIASFGSSPPGVTFAGFVEDLDRLYGETRVVACPIMVGGGTRVKLIEAASYGRAMVSTRIGAEGLDFEPEREILLRDDDAGFAAACAWLLCDDAACARLGEAARAKMETCYGATEIAARMARIMKGEGSGTGIYNTSGRV